jgi:DNA-binding GntR family transcriptional regulator
MLEGLATRKAAIRATAEDSETLARLNDEIQRAHETSDTVEKSCGQ